MLENFKNKNCTHSIDGSFDRNPLYAAQFFKLI